MVAWCGQRSSENWQHWTLPPCKGGTVAAAALLLVACAACCAAMRRIKLLSRHRGYLTASTMDGLTLAAAVLLACSHLSWLVFLAVNHGSEAAAPFAMFVEAASFVSWAVTGTVCLHGRRRGTPIDLRLLAWPAVLVYSYWTYTQAQIYVQHWDISDRHLALAMLATASAQAAAALTVAAAESLRRTPPEVEQVLKQALLTDADPEAPPAKKRKRSWLSLLGTSVAYVWPSDRLLQLRVVLCVLLVLAMRVLNLLVPITYKLLVDRFADVSARTHPEGAQPRQHFTFHEVFYPAVLAYIVAAFLQGGAGSSSMGLLSNARQWLWIPVSQSAYRRASLDVFSHALDLDLNFHLHRKTGELMRIMDRGTNSMQSVLSTVVFNIGPQLFDIIAACAYLATQLEAWIALIVFLTLFSYIPLTIYLTEWRGNFRRDLNRLDNAKSAKATDALLNYETVKYFNNERLERNNLEDAIRAYQKSEYTLIASLNLLNVLQSAIIWSGLISGLLVCTRGVAAGNLTVGDAVLFVTLMNQLLVPLNWFGSYYRSLQSNAIDLENMFELFATHAKVQDQPGARDLKPSAAPEIAFEDVSFGYLDDTPILKGVSFTVPSGRTVALVGATGSGKSTVLRLLFRFYDPTSGVIKVDGVPISQVTQKSLRAQMAVVPQDTVLFNDTIRYNLRYGRAAASDGEVDEAAQAAALHGTITDKFPQGYGTIVGERGLRLSGGEKQRVAFARAILKDPSILLLDEATSALDTLTERSIQAAIRERKGRTTIIVAHRLSTIVDADTIVVLQDGQVAEMGSHAELIAQGGLYSLMWARQAEATNLDKVASSASLAAAAAEKGQQPAQSSPGLIGRVVGGAVGMLGFGSNPAPATGQPEASSSVQAAPSPDHA